MAKASQRKPQSNWRRELILLSVVGMDLTWLAPWTAVLTGTLQEGERSIVVIWLLALLLGALAVARLLAGSALSLGMQQALSGLLAVGSGFLLIGVYLYPDRLAGLSWPLAWILDLAYFRGYGLPGLALMGVSLYGWWRGIGLAQNRLGADAVGLFLRAGVVAWFCLYLVSASLGVVQPAGWLLVFFLLGLLAVGLARVEEVRQEAGAVRSPFAASWLLIMAASALAVVAVGLAAAAILTIGVPAGLLLIWGPLQAVLRGLVYSLSFLAFLILEPLLRWLTAAMVPLIQNVPNVPTPGPTPPPLSPETRVAAPPVFRGLLWAAGGLVFIGIVTLIVLRLRQRPREIDRQVQLEAEWARAEAAGGEGLGARLQHLRDRLAGALRAVRPVSYPLVTVRDIYASLLRLAAQKGVARHEAETPYEYEHRLDAAWPAARSEVRTITESYVHAHYGEREFSELDVDRLRADWQRIRDQTEDTDHDQPHEKGLAR